jgi:TRAP-type C4-dicarboxylate transport system permease small subunit
MRGLLDCVVHLLDVFFKGVALSAGVAVIATVAVISYGVLAREALHLSDVWVTEVTTYLMAYMTFVGTAALAWQSRHLKIDVLGHHLNDGGRRVLAAFSTLVMSAGAVVIAVLAAQFWWDAYTSVERSWGMFSFPLWIPYLCLVAGALLLSLVQLVRLATIVFARRELARDLSVDELVLGRDK